MLTITDRLPEGLLESDARTLHRVLAGPTLIHLPGRRTPPLFVSVLLHGNEDVGVQAIQRVLAAWRGRELPRALSVFIGNVSAARENVRRLDGQPDYNRVWPGTEQTPTPESAMLAAVVDEMRARQVFASVDLHNNTGLNPHYACIGRVRHPDLQLAALFSRTVVYFRRPLGVQTIAFGELCPAVTCECGKTGDESGIAHAAQFLDACLHLAAIPAHPARPGDVHLFHTIATAKIPPAASFSFDGEPADLRFRGDLEQLNFRELPAGSVFARCSRRPSACLDLRDEQGRDIGEALFALDGDALRLKRPVMPAMLTRDARAIREDCLCYFMERHRLPE
jgi:hypothetical protein